MAFVKVRETYDLHTTKNKMTVIGIHTPKPDIIKKNYPGLLMQCKAYRPVSADVRVACASMLPLDPQGVGLAEGDVAPEDVFNPILYKAMSNKGMSQLEARLNAINMNNNASIDVNGDTALVEVDNFTAADDEFAMYYGLLSNTHDWKHANPQAGLSMSNLRPLVYEIVYNIGDSKGGFGSPSYGYPSDDGSAVNGVMQSIIGSAKPMPFIPCTSYGDGVSVAPMYDTVDALDNPDPKKPNVHATDVPYINVICGCIIVPPSRLHELFYRMVVEWTIEFSQIRPIGEIVSFNGLSAIGQSTHYQNYSYAATKEVVTGTDKTVLENDACMISANVDVNKVM